MNAASQSFDKAPEPHTLFEKLFEFSPDGILVADEDGKITQANPQLEQLFGYGPGELQGEPIETLIPERFRAAHPIYRKTYSSDPHMRPMGAGLELFGRRKDGTEFPVDIMLSPLEIAEGRRILAVVRDITDQKLANEALRHSEQQFRSLFEFSPDGILVAGQDGRIRQANPQVERLFGYRQAELQGQPVEILIPERFRSSHPAHRVSYGSKPRMRPMGAGLELFARKKDGSEFPVDIMLSPIETSDGRVILTVIRDISEKKLVERLSEEKQYLEAELSTEHSFDDIIGENSGLKQTLQQAATVAKTDSTVLILGETGTGKELIARAIHRISSRKERAFVRLNCAAIPAGLLESELFGHERGAFTGAVSQKVGRLELAHQGTLFLDEIGDLPLELQPKILRALQEKEFERLGGTKTISVDLRLIAATHRKLAKMVDDGQFRSDLYYRLKVFPVSVPPLRERRDDIPLLVSYFVEKHARRMNKRIETIPPETMQAFSRWKWPGNVRELENFIERAVILSPGAVLRAPLTELELSEETAAPETRDLETAERDHILKVLREAKGMISGPKGAAARLGLKRTTLNSKLKKLGITREDYISPS